MTGREGREQQGLEGRKGVQQRGAPHHPAPFRLPSVTEPTDGSISQMHKPRQQEVTGPADRLPQQRRSSCPLLTEEGHAQRGRAIPGRLRPLPTIPEGNSTHRMCEPISQGRTLRLQPSALRVATGGCGYRQEWGKSLAQGLPAEPSEQQVGVEGPPVSSSGSW